MTKNTPGYDRLKKTIAEMGAGFTVTSQLSDENTVKLNSLAAKDRPFMKVTPALTASAVRFMQAELEYEPTAPPAKLIAAAAEGIRAHVLLRFATGGNDVSLRPLTLKYVVWKRLQGLNNHIGQATRSLMSDLASCKFTYRKG